MKRIRHIIAALPQFLLSGLLVLTGSQAFAKPDEAIFFMQKLPDSFGGYGPINADNECVAHGPSIAACEKASTISESFSENWRVLGPALSYHESRTDIKGRAYNEVHLGVGLEYRQSFGGGLSQQPYLALGSSLLKDSFESSAVFLTSAIRWPLLPSSASLVPAVGIMGGATYKRSGWDLPKRWRAVGGIQLSIEHSMSGAGVVLTWSPRPDRPQDGQPRSLWTLQSVWGFDI